MEISNTDPPVVKTEEVKTTDLEFVDDEGNIAIRHLYGEVVWLKSYEYPYWPAIVLDPRWLPPALIENLKINKKKAHSKVIAQFFDESSSSQVVSLKSICYPFDAFYNEYKDNKIIDPIFIEKAKSISEMSRIDRCRLYNENAVESNLLQPHFCIVCNKPIEDLDSMDIRIVRGNTGIENGEEHYQNKSYFRCTNPQCLSLYHKACVPNCVVGGRCGVCKIEAPPERKKHIVHIVEEEKEKKKEMEESRNRRYESRHENEEEERRGIKRQPHRNARAPTYHEEPGSSDEEEKRTVSKKRKITPARTKSTDSKNGGVKETEIHFIPIASEQVFPTIKDAFLSVYNKKINKTEENAFIKEFKQNCRSLVAWFSSFDLSQQHILYHFFVLLSQHYINGLKEFAGNVVQLLEKKISRHQVDISISDFSKDISFYNKDLEEKRVNAIQRLSILFNKPESYLLCRFIESIAFSLDSSVGEIYEKYIQMTITHLQENEEIIHSILSGTTLVTELFSKS